MELVFPQTLHPKNVGKRHYNWNTYFMKQNKFILRNKLTKKHNYIEGFFFFFFDTLLHFCIIWPDCQQCGFKTRAVLFRDKYVAEEEMCPLRREKEAMKWIIFKFNQRQFLKCRKSTIRDWNKGLTKRQTPFWAPCTYPTYSTHHVWEGRIIHLHLLMHKWRQRCPEITVSHS